VVSSVPSTEWVRGGGRERENGISSQTQAACTWPSVDNFISPETWNPLLMMGASTYTPRPPALPPSRPCPPIFLHIRIFARLAIEGTGPDNFVCYVAAVDHQGIQTVPNLPARRTSKESHTARMISNVCGN
jgi:hypothetical protein